MNRRGIFGALFLPSHEKSSSSGQYGTLPQIYRICFGRGGSFMKSRKNILPCQFSTYWCKNYLILEWITLWYSFYTITTLFLLIGFPTNTKIAKSCFFSLKMWKITTLLQVTFWNIQNPSLKNDMLRPFLKSAPYIIFF